MSARALCIVLLSGCGFHSSAPAVAGDAAPPGDAALDSASSDSPGDAGFCLGTGVVMACLAQAPAASLTIDRATMIDTDHADDCAPNAVGPSASYCILAK